MFRSLPVSNGGIFEVREVDAVHIFGRQTIIWSGITFLIVLETVSTQVSTCQKGNNLINTHALASPSPVTFGRYGATMSRFRNFSQSTSRNHWWEKTSPAPFRRFPYRFEGLLSRNFKMRSFANMLIAGKRIHDGPLWIRAYNAIGESSGRWNGGRPVSISKMSTPSAYQSTDLLYRLWLMTYLGLIRTKDGWKW